MPQMNVILDDATAKLIREGAKTQSVSISHYLNNLIQRALILEEGSENIESLLKQPKFVMAFKKLLTFNTESLALIRFMVESLGEREPDSSNQIMLQKAKTHAESYVSGLFEEWSTLGNVYLMDKKTEQNS